MSMDWENCCKTDLQGTPRVSQQHMFSLFPPSRKVMLGQCLERGGILQKHQTQDRATRAVDSLASHTHFPWSIQGMLFWGCAFAGSKASTAGKCKGKARWPAANMAQLVIACPATSLNGSYFWEESSLQAIEKSKKRKRY